MNDFIVTYIERDTMKDNDDELIIQRFQKMAKCKGQLQSLYANLLFFLQDYM